MSTPLSERSEGMSCPSERGRALVSSRDGWRTQLARWIGDTRAAERTEDDSDLEGNDDDESTLRIPNRLPAWKPVMLAVLFGGAGNGRVGGVDGGVGKCNGGRRP
ncbi:hypothetical protein B0H13DRAFT_1867972 [Mycena leptocephala]|nr:hypothetical protein B0H13DRAFT_1867972 [Mycena leptocephala]